MSEEIPKETSEFNEAALQISRLHNIWLKCQVARETGLIDTYQNVLRSAETELHVDAGLIDNKYLKDLKDIEKKIRESDSLILKTIQDSIYQQAAMNNKWASLIEKEKLLREIQDKSGKGAKRSDPSEDGMD